MGVLMVTCHATSMWPLKRMALLEILLGRERTNNKSCVHTYTKPTVYSQTVKDVVDILSEAFMFSY